MINYSITSIAQMAHHHNGTDVQTKDQFSERQQERTPNGQHIAFVRHENGEQKH